jgi:LacI family transcriptional regulator
MQQKVGVTRYRKTTLKDVARLAGVSTVTVSNVLNRRNNVSALTRERVLGAVEKTGYRANLVARGLAGGRTNTLGVLVPDLGTQYIGEIVRGLDNEIRRAGLEILISTASSNAIERSQVDMLHAICDGLILVLPHCEKVDLGAAATEFPVVLIDPRGTVSRWPTVDIDNYRGGRQATEYLLKLGHRRIAYISGKYEASRLRQKGYKEALMSVQIELDESLIVEGDFSRPGGFAAASKVLRLAQPPTAIFAANDLSAAGAMEAIKERGLRVPADISVMGYDDIPLASQVFPPLTTIRQPLLQMGEAAARMMLGKLKGVDPPSNRITLTTELVERASAAALDIDTASHSMLVTGGGV